jgi:hypothetical protein
MQQSCLKQWVHAKGTLGSELKIRWLTSGEDTYLLTYQLG